MFSILLALVAAATLLHTPAPTHANCITQLQSGQVFHPDRFKPARTSAFTVTSSLRFNTLTMTFTPRPKHRRRGLAVCRVALRLRSSCSRFSGPFLTSSRRGGGGGASARLVMSRSLVFTRTACNCCFRGLYLQAKVRMCKRGGGRRGVRRAAGVVRIGRVTCRKPCGAPYSGLVIPVNEPRVACVCFDNRNLEAPGGDSNLCIGEFPSPTEATESEEPMFETETPLRSERAKGGAVQERREVGAGAPATACPSATPTPA